MKKILVLCLCLAILIAGCGTPHESKPTPPLPEQTLPSDHPAEDAEITAPVTEFKMNGIDQDASNKNLNMEMEFINDYDEAIIMFDNTANTYKCTK